MWGGHRCLWCVLQYTSTCYIPYIPVLFPGHVHNMQRIAPISSGVDDFEGFNKPQAPRTLSLILLF